MRQDGHIAAFTGGKRARKGAAALAAALVALPALVACGGGASTVPLGALANEAPARGVAPGPAVTSSRFDVQRDGFSFENYDNSANPTNLNPASMKALFGAKVCARITPDGCTLTAPAATWMAVMNSAMNGGHCFGMAALAALYFDKTVRTTGHGAATTYALQSDSTVQGMIARLFATQATSPEAKSAESLPVKDALDRLQRGWAAGKLYLLAIRAADGSSGHAVTPIALTKLDGGGQGLVVYDNNYPGERRVIRVNPAADTWDYTTPTNPSQAPDDYRGDARNQLTLYSPTTSLKTQDCPFCGDGGTKDVYVVLDEESARSGVTVSVTDLRGRPLPGVSKVPWLSDESASTDGSDTLLRVPGGAPFRVTMTGTKAGDPAFGMVSVIGAGWSDEVAAVELGQAESDSLDIDPRTGSLAYTSTDAERPVLSRTVNEGDTSYQFAFDGARIDADGGRLELAGDLAKRVERITSHGAGKSVMRFAFMRIGPTGTQTFGTDQLVLGNGQSVIAEYGAWKGAGTPLTVGIDETGSGVIERTLRLQQR